METGRVDTRSTVKQDERWIELDRSYRWSDLVLPEHVHDRLRALARKAHRRDPDAGADQSQPGLTVVFFGESGTGKTMAARVLAAELARPLIEVDLYNPALADKRDIDAVFAVAKRNDAILVFDVNRRSDRGAVPDPAATPPIESSRLMRRCELYPGIVIFKRTPGDGIDFSIEEAGPELVRFPFPDEVTRHQIWRAELPSDALIEDDTLHALAISFRLSGREIHECCQVAIADARLDAAPVALSHIMRAVEQVHPGLGAAVGAPTRRVDAAPTVPAAEVRRAKRPATTERREPAAKPTRSEPAAKPTRSERPAKPRHREPTRTRPAPSGHAVRKWVLAAVIAVAAVVLGFVIARAGDSGTQPAPHDRHAANGVLSVSFPAGWQRQPVPQNVTHGLSDALALAPKAPARGVLVLGHTQSPATSQVSQVLSGQPTVSGAQIVTLGGVRFYRYSVKSSPTAGSSSSLYALPTTSGTVVGVCSMQGARPAFAAECERILASLRLASARPLIAGPSTAFGAALSGVITKLTSTRTTAERQLAAAQSGAAQAHAASALAAAYRHAAAAVGGLSAGQASGATAALAQALGKTADSYTALARAAATGDGTSYRAAEQTLSTERAAVATAIAQLGAFGYRAA